MALPGTYEWYLEAPVSGGTPAGIAEPIGPGGLLFQVDEDTAAVWHFDELAGVPPSDAAANVEDLAAPAGLTVPTRAEGIVGWGREWAAAQGFKGAELVVDALKLRRSMSVEVLVKPNGDGTRYLVQRGANIGGSAAPATVEVTFERAVGDGAAENPATIPAGWLISTPGGIEFTTDVDADFLADEWQVTVAATAVVAGLAGNVGPGTITVIDDPDALLPDIFLPTVTNILAATGGAEDASVERILWGLKLTTAGGVGTLQMYWQRASGAAAVVPGAAFDLPVGGSGWLLVGAARRWLSATEVEVDYFVNGEFLGTTTSAHGDIEGGDNGTVYIGVADGAGTPALGMVIGDRIDEIRISAVTRTPEEIRQVFRRLFVYTVWARELVRSLTPPGIYSKDPDSIVQRRLNALGDGFAIAWALAEELGDDFLPDRATRSLKRWETVTRLPAKPDDTIGERRRRVLAFLAKIHGYSRAKIAETIAPLLDVEPEELLFIEHSNRLTDDFAAGALGSLWISEPRAGTITQAAGALTLDFQAADDARWNAAQDLAVRVRRGLDAVTNTEVYAALGPPTLANTGDFAGLYLWTWGTGDSMLFGVRNNGVDLEFASQSILAGVSTVTSYVGAVPGGTLFLRMRHTGAALELAYSTVGFDGPWTIVAAAAAAGGLPYWAGVFLAGGQAAPASASSAAFPEARLWMPESRRVFEWRVYRNPIAPGNPDYETAKRVIQEMQPAHTNGIIYGTLFLTDDPESLTDDDLLGG